MGGIDTTRFFPSSNKILQLVVFIKRKRRIDYSGDYILAQAPFDSKTESDFWRLVYQVQPRLMVLLTATENNNGEAVVRKFFPEPKQQREYGEGRNLSVSCTRVDQVSSPFFGKILVRPATRAFEAVLFESRFPLASSCVIHVRPEMSFPRYPCCSLCALAIFNSFSATFCSLPCNTSIVP